VSRVTRGILLYAFFLATSMISAIANAPLKGTCTTSIARLEVTGGVENARFIVLSWDKERPCTKCPATSALHLPLQPRRAAIAGVCFDFLFILAYGVMLWNYCRWAGDACGEYDRQWKSAGMAFARAARLAALLDVVENIGLLLELNFVFNPWITGIKAAASMIKWVLALLVVVFVIVSWSTQIRMARFERDHDEDESIDDLLLPPATEDRPAEAQPAT